MKNTKANFLHKIDDFGDINFGDVLRITALTEIHVTWGTSCLLFFVETVLVSTLVYSVKMQKANPNWNHGITSCMQRLQNNLIWENLISSCLASQRLSPSLDGASLATLGVSLATQVNFMLGWLASPEQSLHTCTMHTVGRRIVFSLKIWRSTWKDNFWSERKSGKKQDILRFWRK